MAYGYGNGYGITRYAYSGGNAVPGSYVGNSYGYGYGSTGYGSTGYGNSVYTSYNYGDVYNYNSLSYINGAPAQGYGYGYGGTSYGSGNYGYGTTYTS